jgi:hypothetical protein
MTDPTKLNRFLVIGIYDDNKQRYADYVDATTAEEAEDIIDEQLAADGFPITIAAVFEVLENTGFNIPDDFEVVQLVR